MMNKDWNGNAKSVFVCNGASNHSEGERQEQDFYATEPEAIRWLMKLEKLNENIWECACGAGHMAIPLMEAGYTVRSTDLIERGFGIGGGRFPETGRSILW